MKKAARLLGFYPLFCFYG